MAACADSGATVPVASAVNARASVRDDRVRRPFDRSVRVFVAGGSGLVGSAVRGELRRERVTDVVAPGSAELDLRERQAVFDWFAAMRPDVVVLAAARVGGIKANATRPAEFLSDNLRIQVNMLDAALEHGWRGCCSWVPVASTRSSLSSPSARRRC